MSTVSDYPIPVFRLQLVREGAGTAPPITCAEDAARLLEDVAVSDREQMVALFLDTKHRPLGRHVISIGTLNASLIHPRETLKCALLANAHAFILAHNHPSGDVTPSREDDRITQTIAKAGHLLQVALLDHVILSPGGSFYSYQEQRPEALQGGA